MSADSELPQDMPKANVKAPSAANRSLSGAAKVKANDNPVENFRSLKVIVIGAGYSGIYHGIRIPERIKNCELVIYEKNAGVGGAWYVQ
jgi:ribulose 1,5-bisphosphate synthetase/thiazole synthase